MKQPVQFHCTTNENIYSRLGCYAARDGLPFMLRLELHTGNLSKNAFPLHSYA